jgi:hypothetical protein
MEDQTTETQNTETPAAPSLALSDLVLLLNLVRVTAERGAIKADEMNAVGAVYEKLFQFLQASGALAQTQSEDTPAVEETPAE